jgi:glycosyltransferase involved in cell wall biosynthesis
MVFDIKLRKRGGCAEMKNPLVSIVIPVYNAERYMARCLDSIAVQTFQSIEVIIVDDGSTDSTSAIVEVYLSKYPWFKCITQTNKGPGEARNSGIAASRGKYIAFIDADDYITPDFTEVLFNLAKENNADIAVCNFYVLLPNGLLFPYPFSTFVRKMSGSEGARKTLSMVNLPGVVWNKLYLRELFIDHDIKFPSIYYEDAITVCMLMINAKTVASTKKTCYYYLRHKQSITSKFNDKHVNDYLKAAVILRDYLVSLHLWYEWEKPFNKFLRRVEAHLLIGIGFKKNLHNGHSRREEMHSVHRSIRMLKKKPSING